MKGDFTDEFLEDEDVEEDDNDNEELQNPNGNIKTNQGQS